MIVSARHVVHVLPHHFGWRVGDLADLQTRGGGERAFFQLAKAMSSHVRTTAVTFGATRHTHHWGDLCVEIYPARPLLPAFNGPGTPFSLRFLRELDDADVAHVFQIHSDTALLAALKARSRRIPVFATDYGYLGLNLSRLPLVPMLSDGVLAISRFAARQYARARRVETIWAGVDLDAYPFSVEKQRAVLCVARILPHKGINYLIEAMDADTPLTIVGRGGHGPYLEYLRGLSQGKNVRFLIDASDDEARAEYARAAVVVLPSVYRDMYGKWYPRAELFGLALAEGMASGAACVTTRVGALPEVVQDQKTGFVVPPNSPDALRARIFELLDQPDLATAMGRGGRAYVEDHFTWEAVARRCLACYEDARGGRDAKL